MWIEIFRTGTHKDSSGKSFDYSIESLDAIAQKYNSVIAEDSSLEAPLVKGHPKSGSPAFGWVDRLARRGLKLMANIKKLSPEIVENIKDGLFKKVSIALYPDMMLRHVGLLGGMPPLVKGLRSIEFSTNGSFEEFSLPDFFCSLNLNKHPGLMEMLPISEFAENISEQNIQQVSNEDSKTLESYKQKIELMEKEHRLKEFRDFANSLISGKDGAAITPAQAELLVDILENAYMADVLNTDKKVALVELIMAFVSKLKPSFDTKEFAVGGSFLSMESAVDYSKRNVSKERLNLHEKALEIKRNAPGMAYEEAVCVAQEEGVRV